MKDKAIHDAMDSIENHVKDVYNQGYSDGLADGNINSGLFADKVREAYNNGLEDAWECARKLLYDDSLSRDILTELGADTFCGIIQNCSASEAIEKIKEYEEKKEKDYCEGCRYWDKEAKKGCKSPCVEKIKHEEQQKQSEKSCDSCRFADLQEYEYPCSACSASHTFRWEARKGAEE